MTSIFVAKLDFNTTDEELKSLFEQHGKVNRVTIAKDRETGKPRGFAFVEMFNDQEAEAAIRALDNIPVHGRPIAVKKADDRGGKPGGNTSGDRPQRQDNRPPRQDSRPPRVDQRSNDERPPFRKEESFSRPAPPPENLAAPVKSDRKKEKEKDPKASAAKDAPKKNKMEAYRKSGKDNQFLDDDDLADEELDLFGRNAEDDEDEDDYRKYLVNSDDDDDDYDDDDWDDDDDYEDEE